LVHELKVLPQYFKPLVMGKKTFEIRKADRDFKVGDTLVLREWDGEKYTGSYVRKYITYILRNCPEYGLMDGYCILAFRNTARPTACLD